MKKLIIIANPNKESFSHAMAEAYIQGSKNDEIEILDLYDSPQDFLRLDSNETEQTDQIKTIQKAIESADELAFFFPVWWGNMPAILKNFFDVNFSAGFAFKYIKGKSLPEKLLTGKTAKVFCTCDALGFVYKIPILGIWLKRYLSAAILGYCGVKLTNFQLFDTLRKTTLEQRKDILQKIETTACKNSD